jgi:hypothetical protein
MAAKTRKPAANLPSRPSPGRVPPPISASRHRLIILLRTGAAQLRLNQVKRYQIGSNPEQRNRDNDDLRYVRQQGDGNR